MRQIVEWGKPAKISERIYHRGCIKLPDLDNPVDIVLLNTIQQYKKIGEAYLIENGIGIFVKDVNWNIDIDYLDKVMYGYNQNKTEGKYDPGVTISLLGHNRAEYVGKDELEFKFLTKMIDTTDGIEGLIRDIRLSSIV